jgi:hypothetical protein
MLPLSLSLVELEEKGEAKYVLVALPAQEEEQLDSV